MNLSLMVDTVKTGAEQKHNMEPSAQVISNGLKKQKVLEEFGGGKKGWMQPP